MHKYKNRNEVPEKYKWDLSDFFLNDSEFYKSLELCKTKIDELSSYVGCTNNADSLYEFLSKQTETVALCQNLYVYSYLINDQELGNSLSIERFSKARDLNSKLEASVSFFASELLKLSNNKYKNLFVENSKLLEYKFELDKIYRDRDHILNDNEERIVSELVNSMDCFSSISSTLLNSEHDYGTVELGFGVDEIIATNNYGALMKNDDINIRKKVYNSFQKVLDQYGNTCAGLLNGYVSMKNSVSRIRHFDSAWDNKLFDQNLSNNVYESLVDVIENNVSSMHRFYKLKKDVLELDLMHFYDLSLRMSNFKREYSVDEAQKLVRNSLEPLGESYLEKFDKIIKNRYIDYCQYKGKCSGGYSFSTISHNSRILMSFNGDLNSVSTIAHEVGHNINHQFINENNPLQYRLISSLTSEVASLTNECLLSYYIVENAESVEEKLAGLENIINVIIGNFFESVREGKMEQDMYNYVLNGNSLTKDYLDQLTLTSLKKYYGEEVEMDNYSKNGWIKRSHYYMNFYIYSYAICVSVAVNSAKKIIENDSDFVSKYIDYLKTGSDVWPIDVYKKLGIDLECKDIYINTVNYFNDLIDKYYKIFAERK